MDGWMAGKRGDDATKQYSQQYSCLSSVTSHWSAVHTSMRLFAACARGGCSDAPRTGALEQPMHSADKMIRQDTEVDTSSNAHVRSTCVNRKLKRISLSISLSTSGKSFLYYSKQQMCRVADQPWSLETHKSLKVDGPINHDWPINQSISKSCEQVFTQKSVSLKAKDLYTASVFIYKPYSAL